MGGDEETLHAWTTWFALCAPLGGRDRCLRLPVGRRGEGFESEKTFSGRLVLGQVTENRADIVGIFTIDKGRAYPVKLENETLLNELKEYDRKTVSLQGKFRNQGKYFVVTAIIPPPAPTPRVRKIGGL